MKKEGQEDARLTPQKAIELLQIIKNNTPNLSVVIGFDHVKNIKDFIIVCADVDSELQAELLLNGYCHKTSVTKPKDVTVSQFKEILSLVDINPLVLLGTNEDLAQDITDIAVDNGALFRDANGEILRVLGVEDRRTVKDFMEGNNEDGILVMFSGNSQKSETAGRSHNIRDVRSLIKKNQLSALF